MKPDRQVGIIGYGGYIPRFRIDSSEIDRVWRSAGRPPARFFKAVPGPDEDTTTIAIQAARNAMRMARIDPDELRAVWFGTESKPYAVKPTSTIVADAIGALPHANAADWEFACKPGTEAMQAAIAMVGSGMAPYALCGGADTSQARPGDVLEFFTGAGGAAYILGPADKGLATVEASNSYVTNTPDFFRREGQAYPSHGQRFTGEPAYFHHIQSAVEQLFAETGHTAADYRFAVFHQPNYQFPLKVAASLGFPKESVAPFILTHRIGNTYSGAALLGFAKALDEAEPGDRILLASYGSGAGSDAFSFVVTEGIAEIRQRGIPLETYLSRHKPIDYALYARYRGKLRLT
ncbi:MAG: hydroxymethylglutaryl-CoA synthase [Myxococcales bacterium]|jgi:hydroxymethylglutaryl-CoA synthase|nr:hydroxymethylglutaryl-CoA synthase [Myxococcales bacterium]